MSVSKMMARIVNLNRMDKSELTTNLARETYGISDPLTQFSIILSALLHDANHVGIPNNALAQEDPALAAAYDGKSVAEQNSVDKAWTALMRPEFHALRQCIYCNETELRRFRSIVVNSIMATDIFDAELGSLRKARWNKVFKHKKKDTIDEGMCEDDDDEVAMEETMTLEDVNRKATLVIEHLIQASDVAHTMQHWQVYLEWNSRLFEELYISYRLGRTDKDPSGGWFKGEIWFFDNYVIPLAQKLKECGVFGVSSDEYLNYAVKNRREWELQGEQVVADLVAKVSSSFDLEQATLAQQERSNARGNASFSNIGMPIEPQEISDYDHEIDV
jgi:3'5'-cyclic nucleotide phosphodiesterase